MTTPLVTVVGSINQDITVTVDRFPAPGETLLGSSVDHRLGGKGANQAVAVARTGVRSRFVGLTGEDAAADALTAEMVRYRVDVEFLARTPAGQQASLKAEQRGWIKGRNDCWKTSDQRGCIKSAYEERISELENR